MPQDSRSARSRESSAYTARLLRSVQSDPKPANAPLGSEWSKPAVFSSASARGPAGTGEDDLTNDDHSHETINGGGSSQETVTVHGTTPDGTTIDSTDS